MPSIGCLNLKRCADPIEISVADLLGFFGFEAKTGFKLLINPVPVTRARSATDSNSPPGPPGAAAGDSRTSPRSRTRLRPVGRPP